MLDIVRVPSDYFPFSLSHMNPGFHQGIVPSPIPCPLGKVDPNYRAESWLSYVGCLVYLVTLYQ